MISNYILAVLSASTGVHAVTGKFEVRYYSSRRWVERMSDLI